MNWANYMMNNLDVLIQASGKTKREVAELKGVTPETLSRHIHGKIQLTMADAEEYGQILGAEPMSVLYPNVEMKIIGTSFIHDDETTSRTYNKYGLGVAKMRLWHWQNLGVVVWECDPKYNGSWRSFHNAWSVFDTSEDHFPVPKSCYQSMSMVVLEEPMEIAGRLCEHIVGVVYPEPEGTCAVKINQERNKNIYRGLIPVRAYPLISIIYRPDLRQGKIIWNK